LYEDILTEIDRITNLIEKADCTYADIIASVMDILTHFKNRGIGRWDEELYKEVEIISSSIERLLSLIRACDIKLINIVSRLDAIADRIEALENKIKLCV
jgi:hypothetical protein